MTASSRKQVGYQFWHEQHKEWQFVGMDLSPSVLGWYANKPSKPVFVDISPQWRRCKWRRQAGNT